jgi:ATP-dependent Lon protease
VPYDLSRVLFIATANVLDPIQPAFLDRMEVIRLSGYTTEEKKAIARRHLIPKQMEENGVSEANVEFTDSGVEKVIEAYTREAGLRNLEREIGAICRKVAVSVAKGKERRYRINSLSVEKMLGPVKHFRDEQLKKDQIGVATGLAWTSVGGDLLFVEALGVRGKGGLRLTGQLGDVMKRPRRPRCRTRAPTPRSSRSRPTTSKRTTHIHVPEGAIPKDTLGRDHDRDRHDFGVHAAQGAQGRGDDRRDQLRGEVLPIGGVKEKVLAARAARITTIILPKLNRRDVTQISSRILHDLTFRYVESMDEVLAIGLLARDAGDESVQPPAPPEPAHEIPVTATPSAGRRAPAAPRP